MTYKTNSNTATSIVFFGTGDVSLETLRGIYPSIKIEAVITKPDLASSDGKKHEPAVKVWANEHNIHCYQPSSKAELSELFSTTGFSSRAGLVVDYGLIIPVDVIDSFELGIINSHFSLLPKWRGADPITWSVLAGDDITGVTIMQLEAGMDTGDILAVTPYNVATDETTQSLTSRLIAISNELLLKTIPAYFAGELSPEPQDDSKATFSRKITKDDGRLKPAEHTAAELERHIRAYLGWPGSYLERKGIHLTIKQAKVAQESLPPGKLTKHNGKLLLGCKAGSLEILSIQPAGKKTMEAKGFMNGYSKLLD
jgi:methionyl-tRNA formyltransferase